MTDIATPARVLLLVGAALGGGAVAAVALAAPTAAAAAGGPQVVELSSDGVGYSASMSGLFGPRRLVPSDLVGDSFWVRNAGGEPAHLAVAVTEVEVSDPALARVLTLAAGPPGRTGPASPLVDAGASGCLTLAAGELLQPGESTEIVAELGVGDLHGTQGQDARVGFSLRVTLSDEQITEVGDTACPPATAPPSPGPPTDGPLPEEHTPTQPGDPAPDVPGDPAADATGGSAPVGAGVLARTGVAVGAVVAAAGALLTAGLAVLLGARRHRADCGANEAGGASACTPGDAVP